jgi:hypothetical protein
MAYHLSKKPYYSDVFESDIRRGVAGIFYPVPQMINIFRGSELSFDRQRAKQGRHS